MKLTILVRKKLLIDLRAAFVQVLTLYTPLFRYGLYYVERIDQEDEDFVYTLVEFRGAEGKPGTVSEPFRERGVSQPTYKANRLYLCSPVNQPLLNLQPLMISRFYEIYFLEYVDKEKSLWYSHCSSPKRWNPPEYYHFLSTQFGKSPDEKDNEGDLVDDLLKANDELVKEESSQRVEEMPLSILLSYLSPAAKQALEIGLGEALRIGQFWLGVEFLLMGLSKQQSSSLSKKLTEIGVDLRIARCATWISECKSQRLARPTRCSEIRRRSFSRYARS